MSSENFVIRDSVQYVYRKRHYRLGSSIRHVFRKFRALKLYVFLTILCGVAGAVATYVSDYTPSKAGPDDMFPSLEELRSMNPRERGELLRKYGGQKELLEKLGTQNFMKTRR